MLSPEVAYHFTDDEPDRWVSRGAIIAWLLVPQLILVLIGVVLSGGSAILSRRYELSETKHIKKILMAMGNMVALPQIILLFAILDFFLYNAYEIRLFPLWIGIPIVLLIGTIVLGVFFLQILRQSNRPDVKQNQE